jgi:hypothetical protein
MYAYRNNRKEHLQVGLLLSPDIGKIAEFKPDYFSEIIFWPRSGSPRRILGQYKFGFASAELRVSQDNESYWLAVWFTKVEEGQKLYTLIMAGKIMPFAFYDGEQHVTAVRNFADLWREFWMLLRTSVSNMIHRLRNDYLGS